MRHVACFETLCFEYDHVLRVRSVVKYGERDTIGTVANYLTLFTAPVT